MSIPHDLASKIERYSAPFAPLGTCTIVYPPTYRHSSSASSQGHRSPSPNSHGSGFGLESIDEIVPGSSQEGDPRERHPPTPRPKRKKAKKPHARANAPKKTRLPPADHPVPPVAHQSPAAGAQSTHFPPDHPSLSLFDYPVPGLTDFNDSDDLGELDMHNGMAAGRSPAPSIAVQYHARKRKSPKAQSANMRPLSPGPFASISSKDRDGYQPLMEVDSEGASLFQVKRPRLRETQPARRAIGSTEPLALFPSAFTSSYLPPLPPLPSYDSDSGTDTDPDIPKVSGLAMFELPPPPRARPQLTPPPWLSSSPSSPRIQSFSQRMAQTPPPHRQKASAITYMSDSDNEHTIPSPIPSPLRHASSSPRRSPLLDHLRRIGGTVDGLSQEPLSSPQQPSPSRPPLAEIDLTNEPDSPLGGSGTRRRPRRATKQAARDRIKGLHQRYGDFVTLKAHERGVAPRPDKDVEFSQMTVLSPAAAAEDGGTLLDDERGEAVDEGDTFDRRPRVRSPSPIVRPLQRTVMSLGSSRRQRQTGSKRRQVVLRDNPRDLFDRMAVHPSRPSGQQSRSPRTTRIDRFLLPGPQDPDFVRVGSRSVRTNLATVLASSKPTSPRSTQRQAYGDVGRKRFRVDRETRDELREVAAEMRHVRDRPGDVERVVQAVVSRSKPVSRSRGRVHSASVSRGPSRGPPRKKSGTSTTSAAAAGARLVQRRSQHKVTHPPRRRLDPEPGLVGELGEEWAQDFDARSDRTPPWQRLGRASSGLLSGDSGDSGFDAVQHGGPMLIRRARTSAASRREQYASIVTSRNVLVNALVPPDSCIFSLVAFLSGDSVEYAGVPPAEFGGQALSPDLAVDYLESVNRLTNERNNVEDAHANAPTFSKPSSSVLLALTSFIDSVDSAGLGDRRQKLLDTLRRLLTTVGTQVVSLQSLNSGPTASATFLDLVSLYAWVALWLTLLNDMPSPTTLGQVLTCITKSCSDPLRSPMFDAFQSLLLLSLVGASLHTLDNDLERVDAAVNAVFAFILSNSPTMTDHDQWRIIMLGQALGKAVQPPRQFIAWKAVFQYLLSRANTQPCQESLAFANVFHLCHEYSWPVEQTAKDVLVKFREMYLETVPPSSAGLKLMDLCPPAGESLQPAGDALVPICFLWMVDQVADPADRDRLIRRLLPVKFTDMTVTAQRLLLALFLRSQLDVMQLVAKLDLSLGLVSVLLPELLDTLVDSTADQALFLKLVLFALQRLESDLPVDSQLQAPLVLFLTHAQGQRPALTEDCLLKRHSVFRKLLSAHMPLVVRAAALELLYNLLRRHVSLPTHPLTLKQAAVQVDSQDSMDELLGLGDDVFAEVFDSLESSMWKSIADRTRYLLAVVEGTILSHNVHLQARDLEWFPESFPTEVKTFTDLYNAGLTVAAMILKIAYLANAPHFHDEFDKRLGSLRWPSADIPLVVRCARTMVMAIKCCRFGCRLPPAKIDALFGIVAFAEGVDHLAVPLGISLLLDCQSSMLLRPCARNLTRISTISRALLLQDVFECITGDIRARRRELRSLAYTLTPPLQMLVSMAEQLISLTGPRIGHLHDLIGIIDLESSIAGHTLPADLRSLVATLQATQPSTVPMSGILKAIQVAATPPVLASVIATGVNGHPELKQLLDRFDSFFNEGKHDELATQLVQLFRSRSSGEHHRVCGPLDHRPCLNHLDPHSKCPLWSPLRALLVWYLLDRRLRTDCHWRGVIDALDFISASFRQLGEGWCLSELDVLWRHLSFFLAVLQSDSQQCRLVSRAIFDAASLCASHGTWLDEDPVFPEHGAPLPFSIPRLLFPWSVEQIERLLEFQLCLGRSSLQTWSEHASAFVVLNNRGESRSPGDFESRAQDIVNEEARLQAGASLFRSVFAFWATCYHVDRELRIFLTYNQRHVEWYLEQHHPTLLPVWNEHFLHALGVSTMPLSR